MTVLERVRRFILEYAYVSNPEELMDEVSLPEARVSVPPA